VPIVQAITAQPLVDDACLHQNFPEAQQLAFGSAVVKRLGYDFERGRQDKTHHPFCTTFSLGDVRITTRVKEYDLGRRALQHDPRSGPRDVRAGDSARVGRHPAGARDVVGRPRKPIAPLGERRGPRPGFLAVLLSEAASAFPSQLANVSLDAFYRAINKVERSLIRTDADEVTYNLHVMIRFDFELQLLEGKLAVRDLPEAWRERYKADLGIASPDDRDGVLQDVHWFGGQIGGVFQGYTLGNILSAQFYDAAWKANPGIPDQIAAANSARCTVGSRKTSTNTAASSPRTRS
jgi:carboxypeptidase Taq